MPIPTYPISGVSHHGTLTHEGFAMRRTHESACDMSNPAALALFRGLMKACRSVDTACSSGVLPAAGFRLRDPRFQDSGSYNTFEASTDAGEALHQQREFSPQIISANSCQCVMSAYGMLAVEVR